MSKFIKRMQCLSDTWWIEPSGVLEFFKTYPVAVLRELQVLDEMGLPIQMWLDFLEVKTLTTELANTPHCYDIITLLGVTDFQMANGNDAGIRSLSQYLMLQPTVPFTVTVSSVTTESLRLARQYPAVIKTPKLTPPNLSNWRPRQYDFAENALWFECDALAAIAKQIKKVADSPYAHAHQKAEWLFFQKLQTAEASQCFMNLDKPTDLVASMGYAVQMSSNPTAFMVSSDELHPGRILQMFLLLPNPYYTFPQKIEVVQNALRQHAFADWFPVHGENSRVSLIRHDLTTFVNLLLDISSFYNFDLPTNIVDPIEQLLAYEIIDSSRKRGPFGGNANRVATALSWLEKTVDLQRLENLYEQLKGSEQLFNVDTTALIVQNLKTEGVAPATPFEL